MRPRENSRCSAPKARNVIAWGNALGEGSLILKALKARNRNVLIALP
jgi:hypothetical protein